MKPVDLKPKHTLTQVNKPMIKIINLKLPIMKEYQNIKTFLQKVMFQIDLINVFTKVKNTVGWTYVISDLNGEEIIGMFCEKELRNNKSKSL